MDGKLISIIIPAYNAENTISTCLDSILNNVDETTEIIIINDGSNDATLSICNNYCTKNKNICVITKKNEGVSIARNEGLAIAQGRWIMFVDSDDQIVGRIGDAFNEITSECDLILMSAAANDGSNIKKYISYKSNYYRSLNLLIKEQPQSILMHGAPWSKFFRKDIIDANGLRFDPQLSIAKDRLFYYNYLMYVREIKTCDDVIYNYSLSENGLRSKCYSEEAQEYRLNNLSKTSALLVQHHNFDINVIKVMQTSLECQFIAIMKAMRVPLRCRVIKKFSCILNNYPPFKLRLSVIVKLFLLRIKLQIINK